MLASVPDVLSDLESLTCADDFKRKLDCTFREFGFNLFCYVGFRGELTREPNGQRVDEDPIYITNVPAAWTDRYLAGSYHEADVIIRECLGNRLPLSWTERFKARAKSPREGMILSECFDFGIRRGFTVPIHGPAGELGIMSLYSDLPDREFLKSTDAKKFDLHMISIYLHDALQRTLATADSAPKPIPLTEREVEILRWTASGKTAWEIGSILKISERTVNFHLQNLMGKLGVHNKTHAAAKAMSFGLIHA